MSLEVIGLVKQYGAQLAVNDVSFVAPSGKITGFLGPNGAGKSTTMKIATGYIRATRGDVKVNGISVSERPLEVKKSVGYLPENNPMYLDMYVKEYLAFIGKAYGMNKSVRTGRINELIELCGLEVEYHKKLSMLSKGYRQRVGLAKALMPDPSVLILDEPTTGLDPNQIIEIRKVIREVAHQKTVILSTHIMQEVEALCNQVVIIKKGSLVANDTLSNLQSKASNQMSLHVTFDAPVDASLFGTMRNLISMTPVSANEIIINSENESLRQEILIIVSQHSLPLASIKNRGGSLQEIFQSLTLEESQL